MASLTRIQQVTGLTSFFQGRLFDVICTQDKCDWSEFNVESPICEALRGTEDLVGDDLSDAEISLSDLPRCGKCGALARPGVVWFGESIPTLNQIDKLVRSRAIDKAHC